MLDLLTPAAPQYRPVGWTAFHLLASRPDRLGRRGELVQLLLDRRADPMRLTARMSTPLHTAAGTYNFDVVQVLLRHPDIQVNAKNKDHKTAFDCAASNSNMLRLLGSFVGEPSVDKTGTSSRDEPNARAGASASRRERLKKWRDSRS